MILIKNVAVLGNVLIAPFEPTLIEIAVAIEKEFKHAFITSGYRPNDTGVHGTWPCRGLDLRSTVYQTPEEVVRWVNEQTIYDSEKPDRLQVALHHNSGRGWHIHLQVHPNTILSF